MIYTSPEPAGTIEVTVSGTTAEGVEVTSAVSTILVRIKDLVVLPASGPGYSTVTSTHHGSNNRSATSVTEAGLAQIVADFRAELRRQEVPDANIPTIVWTSLSLPDGGVFDVDASEDGVIDNLWRPPHSLHRFGTDVDMRTSNIIQEYRDELKEIITSAKFRFPVRAESPTDSAANHWHLRRR